MKSQSTLSNQFRTVSLSLICLFGLAVIGKGLWPKPVSSAQQLTSTSNKAFATPTPATATPALDVHVKDKEIPSMALIGEEFCYTARLTNTGPLGMPGYGPYIRLILPPELDLASASLPGVSNTGTGTEASIYPLAANDVKLVGTIPGISGSTGTLTDPWSNTAVTGDSTYNLWLIAAPIGSLYTDEPPIDLRICLKLDMNAKLGALLKVCHQPVYRYGLAPTGNTAIEGAQQCDPVMPVVVKLTKRAPKGPFSNKTDPPIETATGDCNPITFQLVANIADGKTVTNMIFADMLPPEMMMHATPITITGATGTLGTSTADGFTYNVPTATGTASKEDVIIEFKAFVTDILDETKCETKVVTNTAKLDYSYLGNPILPQQTALLNIEAKHVALQKSAAGPNANPLFVMPGDMVSYTLSAQLSKTVNINLGKVVDKLPNGVGYVGSAVASINGSPFLPIAGTNINYDSNANTVTFNIGSFAACTKLVIRYKGMVNEKYNAPLTNQNVLASDPLLNEAVMFYQIPNGGNTACQDDAKGLVIVKPVEIEKKLITPEPPDGFVPGDVVKFQLSICVPSGDTKDIELADFLPSPIFKATSIQSIDITSFVHTGIGVANYSFTTSDDDNSIKFKIIPSVITTMPSQPVCFQIQFTVKVTTAPFVDDLYLTNLLQSKNVNTQNQTESHLTGVVIHVRAPKLMLTKGVFSSDNKNAVITPPPTTLPVNGDIKGIDQNDKVVFYLTVFNMGGAPAYGVKVEDMLPPGWMYLSGMAVSGPSPMFTTSGAVGTGLNVRATYPATTPLPAGQSWVIKIEAMLPELIRPCTDYVNRAAATWNSAVGAELFSPAKDTATIEAMKPIITKTVTGTSVANTAGNNVAIGEFVTYEIKLQIPEGSFPNVNVTDFLPPGMSVIYTLGPVATADAGITPSLTTGVIGTGGQEVSFNFGTVTNSNINNLPSFITFTIGAVVLNTTGNVNGTMLTNTVSWRSDGCRISASAPPLKIVEPKLQVVKVAKGANGQPITTADAGDTINYEITISHTSATTMDAFVVAFSDLVPPGQTYKPGTLMHMGGLAPNTGSLHEPTSLTDPITAGWSVFPLGSTSTIKFSTMVSDTVQPCTDLTNRASVTWTSLPGGGFPPEPRPLVYFGATGFCPRTGNPSGCGLNNYVATGAAVLAVPGPKITKLVIGNDNEVSSTIDPDVTIGEFIVYRLRIDLPDGVTPLLQVTDFMPAGLRVQSVSVNALNNGTTIPLTNIPAPPITPALPQVCPGGGIITATFGSITVPIDTNPANNFFSVNVLAEVCDIPSNMGMPGNQTMLTNYATVQVGKSGCEVRSNDVTMKVVEPKLTLRKLFDPTMVTEGGVVTITLGVINNGLSDAYFVNIEDPLPTAIFDNVMEVSGTPTGFVFSAPVVGANTLATFTGGTVPKGQTLVFKIKATIKQRCLEETFNNKATIVRARTMPPPPPPDQTLLPEQEPTQPPPRPGRDVSGAMAQAPLMIKPGPHCECYQLSPTLFGSLVEWLRFNETAGEDAFDSSSINNHGKLKPGGVNLPTRIASGAVAGDLSFDGVGDHVEAPPNSALDFGTGDFTLDAWVKTTAAVGTKPIVTKRITTVINNTFITTGYRLYLENGRVAAQVATVNYVAPTTSPNVADGVWHQVTVTVQRPSGGGNLVLYVDGVMVFTGTPALATVTTTAPLWVGRSEGVTVFDKAYFKGEIDEVELFNRALTESEVKGIVAAGSKGKCSCPQPEPCCVRKPAYRAAPNFNTDYASIGPLVAAATCYAPTNGDGDYVLGIADLTAYSSQTKNQNWPAPMYHGPSPLAANPNSWTRANLGNIFGITLDNQGNIYVSATSAYSGADAYATGGPGAIYKIDWNTANISTFATLPNTGPALGNVTYDCRNHQFFASNHEDGLLYRLNPGGIIQSSFDHGVLGRPNAGQTVLTDPGSPGFTPRGRRIWGLAVFNNRVYYSVWQLDVNNPSSSGTRNEIWSVGLTTAGAFDPLTARREIQLPLFVNYTGIAQNFSMPVADISFSPSGRMLLGERGMAGDSTPAAHISRVLEYECTGSGWALTSNDFRIGVYDPITSTIFHENHTGNNAAGGVDYAPNGFAISTGDALHFGAAITFPTGATYSDYIYGLQFMPSLNGLVTIADSYLIDLNGSLTSGDKTQIGDVDIPCLPPGDCTFMLTLTNTPNPLPMGTAGVTYSDVQYTAAGGVAPYMYSATGLPPGMSLSMDGKLTGKPTQQGTFTFTILVKDANGCTAEVRREIVIKCQTFTIQPETLPAAVSGAAYPKQTFTTDSLCPQPITYTVSGTLPPGLTLAGGMLSGTPTQAGSFNFTINAVDACGCQSRRIYTVVIAPFCPVMIDPPFLSNARLSTGLIVRFTATGGTGPYTFNRVTGLLPPGLSLVADGVLSGTPTQAGSFNFTIAATPAQGCSGSREYTLVVDSGGPTISGVVSNCIAPAKRVSGVTLSTSDVPPRTVTTNSAGAYSLERISGSQVALAPAKTGDVNGITSLDAAQTARAAAGLIQFTSCQQLAGDASNNGSVGGTDAAQIARFAATGVVSAGSVVGGWKFTPARRNYPAGNESFSDQNYDAVLVGDVNGSWTPPGSVSFAQNRMAAPQVQLPISLPMVTTTTGASLTIPLNVGGTLTAQDDIIAYDLVVTFDPAVLKLQVTPVDATGTLSSGLTLTPNAANAGQLIVSAYGVNAVIGTGTLLNLKFDVIGAAGSSSVLKIQKLALNDDLQTNLTDGKVTIPSACPTVTGIAPASGAVGTSVTITGTNLLNVTGVKFANNVAAAITGNTATQVTVTVPSGAVSGPITISKTGCADVQTPVFTVTVACPTVSGISPTSGAVGSSVTITGTNVLNVAGVKFANNVAATITGNTATQVTVTVPTGAVSGPITISKTGCADVQTPVFTVSGCTGVTITVNPTTLAAATLNQAPNVTFTATGGTGPYQFTLSAGGLPTGLTLPTSGVMTGAPTVAGTFNFTVRATDANNCMGTRAYTLTVSGGNVGLLASVSAANYKTPLTPEMIVAGFGVNLATGVATASTATLPTTLLGTTVSVTDSGGAVRPGSLFFVSPGQVNYLMPAGMPDGNATVTITSGSGAVSSGTVAIARVSPGIFTSNATGQGVPAALALRITANGAQSYESIAQFQSNSYVPTPIDLGPESDQVFLVLFLTGVRFNSGLSGVAADIGSVNAPVLYAGAQGALFGLDQMNIRLPRTLIGRGLVDLTTTVDGKVTNKVQINVK